MLIALLAVLGVNLLVLVAFAVLVLGRKRWVRHQPGSFAAAIRTAEGEVDGLGSTWHRGYGRWVRDVLVWTKAPFLLRNELVPADGLDGRRPAGRGEVKRLGDDAVVVTLVAGSNRVEVAVRVEDGRRAASPFAAAEPDSGAPAMRPAGTVLTPPHD